MYTDRTGQVPIEESERHASLPTCFPDILIAYNWTPTDASHGVDFQSAVCICTDHGILHSLQQHLVNHQHRVQWSAYSATLQSVPKDDCVKLHR